MGGLLIVCAIAGGGCQAPKSQVEFVSFKDPYFPEPYHVTFEGCTYRVDASGEQDIVGRIVSMRAGTEGGPITQLMHVHLFWQPIPGRTSAEPSTTDATIRYAIITPTGTAVYSGTGFVYPKRGWGRTLSAAVEAANLRLESQTGTPTEVLGDARVHGTLVAREDAYTAVDVMRELAVHAAGR
jgi:hypothetical protein